MQVNVYRRRGKGSRCGANGRRVVEEKDMRGRQEGIWWQVE
jgi:hypothetical protein